MTAQLSLLAANLFLFFFLFCSVLFVCFWILSSWVLKSVVETMMLLPALLPCHLMADLQHDKLHPTVPSGAL